MKALADIPHDYRAFEECFLYDHVGESLEERFFSAYVKGNVALVIREMSDAKKEYVNLLKMNKHYERFWELNPADQSPARRPDPVAHLSVGRDGRLRGRADV
jgi:hypothetical protein